LNISDTTLTHDNDTNLTCDNETNLTWTTFLKLKKFKKKLKKNSQSDTWQLLFTFR